MKQVVSALFVLVAVSACTLPITNLNVSPTEPSAKVRVYREWAFNSGGTAMYFGENRSYYAKLGTSEHVELVLTAGDKNLVAIAPASEPFFFKIKLEPDSITCINAYADPANYAKILFPILMNTTSLFKMEAVSCEHENFVERYPVASSSAEASVN